MQSSSGLNKNLNLVSLIIFGIGIIIGAGVYAVLGKASGVAGNSLWMSFLFAAVVAVLTAFSYCELATLYPTAGAEYIYLKETYPKYKLPSFLLGFVLIIAGSGTAATVAVGFGGYLQHFIDFPKTFAALILIAGVTGINYIGIKNSSRTNLVFTLIEVAGLLAVIWFGFFADPIAKPSLDLNQGTFTASSLIFFVYLGFEDIVNLAEDTNDPEKNIPRAILWSLFITTVLYIAVAIAATRLVPPEVLSRSDLPLAEAVKGVAPRWVNILSAIALFSTANTALITMLAISRMIYGIASCGDLPKFLAKTEGESKTPRNAGLITFICAAAFLFLGGLEILANVSSFAALLGFLTVNFVLIVLRYKKPQLKRPFISPLNIGKFPVLPFLGMIAVIILCFQFSLEVYLIGGAVMLLGILIFFLTNRFRQS